MSLPPVSALHTPYTHHHHHNNNNQMHHGSLSSMGQGKSPIDFGLAPGSHALSIPKSPLGGMDFGLGAFGGGTGLGGVSSPLLPINASLSARNGTNGGVGPPPPSSTTAGNGAFGPGSPVVPSSTVPGANVTVPSNAASGGAAAAGTGAAATGGTSDKQSLLANEKRRRRRESHNAVERRRRDNINEKISELATLIPECMLDGGASTSSGSAAVAANGGANGGGSGSPASPGLLDGAEPLLPIPLGEKGGKDGVAKDEGGEESGVVKANKGMILRKSVEYIRYLQQLVTAQGARNRELEQELKAYRGSVSSGASDSGEPNGKPKSGARDMSADSADGDHLGSHHHTNHSLSLHGANDADAMMLHDGAGDANGAGGAMDFAMGGYVNGVGMLPSMPEDDDELELELAGAAPEQHHHQGEDGGAGMDVDSGVGVGKGEVSLERGRTRGVRRGVGNGSANGSAAAPVLKEEQDDDLRFMVGMQTA
ncbi:HLH-domain-containing protein [Pholiota conissans]|uniref:HLH-domain-containing protein n=1 Tax=Pholiota conissans TaxID=109636 RepID=A0A9P6D7W3_9AGAR|nr:HLH-domain-containing protein [Pholiota conissans]